MAVPKKIQQDYPKNLFEEMLSNDYVKRRLYSSGIQSVDDFPADADAALVYILTTLLPREQEIIKLRYVEKKSYAEIGDLFGITRERARQIENRAILKLSNPNRINIISLGLVAYIQSLQRKIEEKDNIVSTLLVQNAALKQKTVSTDKTEVEKLGFSARTTNCLSKAGIDTITELIAVYKSEKLGELRGLGTKSYREIANFMEERGIYETDYTVS